MDKILHDPKDPKLWELWHIPYYGSCRILSINRKTRSKEEPAAAKAQGEALWDLQRDQASGVRA